MPTKQVTAKQTQQDKLLQYTTALRPQHEHDSTSFTESYGGALRPLTLKPVYVEVGDT
eukprot:m.236018 g.236018  ORF g.236018 m.236018 type:complete len:58 (-) comp15769_c0_seq11:56-229(-)